MYGKLISRRDVVRQLSGSISALAVAAATSPTSAAARGQKDSTGIPVRLVKEFKYARLLALSADGARLCFYHSKRPFRSWTWHGDWSEKKVRKGDEALRVLGWGSWESLYATRLPALPYKASFFGRGEALYVFVPGVGKGSSDHIHIDLPGQSRHDHVQPFDPRHLTFSYWALGDGILLGEGRSEKNQVEVLVRAELPAYNELRRVAFIDYRRTDFRRRETGIRVSADKTTFVYGVDKNVVCRRTDDLGIKWTRQTDPALALPRVAISADAGLVAAYICDYTGIGQARYRYVAVFDGGDGREIARVSADALESLAISPDHKLLAIGQRVPMAGKKAGTQPTVFLYDIASGKKLATLIHDRFRDGGNEFLYAGVRSWFTPDSRYVLTSGLNTKIWEIGRQ